MLTKRKFAGGSLVDTKACYSKSFRQRSVLVVHIKTHTGEMSFLCFVCNRSFYTPGDLKKHVEIHTTALYASRGLGVPVSSELTCDSSNFNEEAKWNGESNRCSKSRCAGEDI